MSVSPSPGTGAVATCLLALLLAVPGRDNPAGALRFRPCGSPESHPPALVSTTRRPSSKRFTKPQKFIDDRLLRFRDQQSRPSRRSTEKENTLGRGFFLGESHAPLIHCGSNRQLPGLRRHSLWKGLFSAERLVCGLPHQGLPRRCSRDAQSAHSGVQGRAQTARSRAACPSFTHATSRL